MKRNDILAIIGMLAFIGLLLLPAQFRVVQTVILMIFIVVSLRWLVKNKDKWR